MMNHGMTPFESYMMAQKEGKRANGVGITGLVLGSVGLVAGVTGWIYANSQAKKAQEVAAAQNNGTAALLNQTAALLATERAERVAGDINLTATINDTVSGSQQSTLTAQQAAELSAINTATAQVTTGLMTGQYSQNPMRVVRVSGVRECGCDDCGCGR